MGLCNWMGWTNKINQVENKTKQYLFFLTNWLCEVTVMSRMNFYLEKYFHHLLFRRGKNHGTRNTWREKSTSKEMRETSIFMFQWIQYPFSWWFVLLDISGPRRGSYYRERDIFTRFCFFSLVHWAIQYECVLSFQLFFHLVCIWHSRPQAWISWGKINRGPPHLTEVVITIIMICTNPATGLIRSVKCSRGSQSASQLVW